MRILLVSLIITSFLVPLNIAKADSHNEGKKFVGASSGYEGREDQLGRAMSVVLMSLNETKPYQHDINDALVKMILTTIQFAKDNNIIDILDNKDLLISKMNQFPKIIERPIIIINDKAVIGRPPENIYNIIKE